MDNQNPGKSVAELEEQLNKLTKEYKEGKKLDAIRIKIQEEYVQERDELQKQIKKLQTAPSPQIQPRQQQSDDATASGSGSGSTSGKGAQGIQIHNTAGGNVTSTLNVTSEELSSEPIDLSRKQ